MQDPWIAPSILSANFAALGDEVSKVLRAGADLIHVDVMDNHYVPNLTFGPLVCAALREHGIQAPIDVHLMVEPVDSLIEPFAQSGANYISFHPEASKHVDRTLQLFHSFGCKAGVVLNPATSLHVLDHILDKIDLVLIMSVNPGFGGQLFLESSIAKIKKLRHILDSHPRAIRLSVDGGVNQENIGKIFAAGADTFVAGSAIFKANDYKAAITNMRQALK